MFPPCPATIVVTWIVDMEETAPWHRVEFAVPLRIQYTQNFTPEVRYFAVKRTIRASKI